jgi:hypothetical protein
MLGNRLENRNAVPDCRSLDLSLGYRAFSVAIPHEHMFA